MKVAPKFVPVRPLVEERPDDLSFRLFTKLRKHICFVNDAPGRERLSRELYGMRSGHYAHKMLLTWSLLQGTLKGEVSLYS